MRKSLSLTAVAAVLAIAGIASLRLVPSGSIQEPKADYFAVPTFDDIATKPPATQPSFAWLDMIRVPDESQPGAGAAYDQTHYSWATRAFAAAPTDDMDGISGDTRRPAPSPAGPFAAATLSPSLSGTKDFGASLNAALNQISTQGTAKAPAGLGAASASDTNSGAAVPFRLFVTNESAINGLAGAAANTVSSAPATIANTATAVTSAVPLKK